ncbi:hypothetical protein [Roseomonas sp. BN140053]|uniref:hypothetical protein n=1 Tax=Roseomonas sp. BN140053 TaxID=3391898 RepID=UPI0039EA4B11
MNRTSLLLLAALCGCAQATPPGPAQRQNDARAASCRQEAERTVLYRDRGQTMRNDDQDARVGTLSNFGIRSTTDRLGATFERNRLADECVRSTEPVVTEGQRPAGR